MRYAFHGLDAHVKPRGDSLRIRSDTRHKALCLVPPPAAPIGNETPPAEAAAEAKIAAVDESEGQEEDLVPAPRP